MMYEAGRERCEITVTSDASDRWGCGAFCRREWFQLRWPEAANESHITVNELVPIVQFGKGSGKESA